MAAVSTSRILTDPRQATPEWLTQVLRVSGYLERGTVTGVHVVSSEDTSTWKLHHLDLRCSDDAETRSTPSTLPRCLDHPSQTPAHLLLKISHNAPVASGVASHHGLSTGKEVWFYTHLATAPEMAAVPLVRCYAAAHDPPYGASHALVEDLSQSHRTTTYPLAPPERWSIDAVECLAALHAAWWGHEHLRGDIAERLAWQRAAASAIGRADPMEKVVPSFLDFVGDGLSPERRQFFERLLAYEPALRRRQDERPPTLVHGDPHWWNFLYPYEPERGRTRVLDWGSWHVGIGTDDVAYMIALHGYRDWRRRYERRLLERYHEALLRSGVRGYTWASCWNDYRLSVLGSLFTPPHFWSINVPAYIWWAKLECGMQAFEDLGCAELLADLADD